MSSNYIGNMIRRWEQEESEKAKQRDSRFEIYNITSPFIVNPSQREYLRKILGDRHINEIETVAMLGHLGILDAGCPPLSNPSLTEEYIDPATGKKMCRIPIEHRFATDIQVSDEIQREENFAENQCKAESDQTGIPHKLVVSVTGDSQCLPVILRGKFQCPPPDNPTLTKMMVLRDGTGVCVHRDSEFNQERVFGKTLRSEQFDADRVHEFIDMYRRMRLYSKRDMAILNGAFMSYDGGMERILENNVNLKEVGATIKNKLDAEHGNIALYLHAKNIGAIPNDSYTWKSFFRVDESHPVVTFIGQGPQCSFNRNNMTGGAELINMIRDEYTSDF